MIRKEPSSRPEDNTWTGFGYMQVYEGSTLTFDVPAIFKDLDYDLVVRYQQQPNHPNPWEKAKVELIRIDGAPDPNGKCKESNDGPTQFSMPSQQRHTIVGNPVCLEEGQRYQIKLTFDQYDPNTPDPKSNILIDSVMLGSWNQTFVWMDCAKKPADWELFSFLDCPNTANRKPWNLWRITIGWTEKGRIRKLSLPWLVPRCSYAGDSRRVSSSSELDLLLYFWGWIQQTLRVWQYWIRIHPLRQIHRSMSVQEKRRGETLWSMCSWNIWFRCQRLSTWV